MNKLIKIFSMILLSGLSVFAVSSFWVSNVYAEEDLDAVIARLKTEVAGLNKHQQEAATSINQVETDYKDILEKARKEEAENSKVTDYDAKIAEAQAKRKAENIDVSAEMQVDLFTAPEDEQTARIEETEPTTATAEPAAEAAAETRPAYPLERNPRYVAPAPQSKSGSKRSRRPFTRSDNNIDYGKLHFASRSYTEKFGFAKEGGVYTGTTEENVFVFSDNLANYCEIDTKSLDKMGECLAKITKDKAANSQSVVDKVTTMASESLQDLTSHAIADSARFKNDSSGYEKNVILPLQEKSSKATDERGDIEVLTLTEMESLKLKNKLLQTYATILAFDSFKDFNIFEVSNQDIADINEEFNAENK